MEKYASISMYAAPCGMLARRHIQQPERDDSLCESLQFTLQKKETLHAKRQETPVLLARDSEKQTGGVSPLFVFQSRALSPESV